jgi:hypothetical protein
MTRIRTIISGLVFLACTGQQNPVDLTAVDEPTSAPQSNTQSRGATPLEAPELFEPFAETSLTALYYHRLNPGYMWAVSIGPITGGTTAKASNIVFSRTCAGDTGHGFMSMTVTPANEGAEMITFARHDYFYGTYMVRMKPSNVAGACHAFFWQSAPEEVDVEFATHNIGTGSTSEVEFTLWPANGMSGNDPRRYKNQPLNFNAAAAFHVYGWKWTADSLVYYVDGQRVAPFSRAAGSPIPTQPGDIWLNAWSSSGAWLLGPPQANCTMIVDWVRFTPEVSTGISDEYLETMR